MVPEATSGTPSSAVSGEPAVGVSACPPYAGGVGVWKARSSLSFAGPRKICRKLESTYPTTQNDYSTLEALK